MTKLKLFLLLIGLVFSVSFTAYAQKRSITAYPVSELNPVIVEKVNEVTDSIRKLTHPKRFSKRDMEAPLLVITNYYEGNNKVVPDGIVIRTLDETTFDQNIYGLIKLWVNTATTKFGYTEINDVSIICIQVTNGINFFEVDKKLSPKKYRLFHYEGVPIDDGIYSFKYKYSDGKLVPILEGYPAKWH